MLFDAIFLTLFLLTWAALGALAWITLSLRRRAVGAIFALPCALLGAIGGGAATPLLGLDNGTGIARQHAHPRWPAACSSAASPMRSGTRSIWGRLFRPWARRRCAERGALDTVAGSAGGAGLMATRMSGMFGRTLREAPGDADSANHQLLLRSGLIVQLAAGVYSFMPPAWRSLRKIEQIVREEMEAAGAQEIRMPAMQPLELWQETGRDRSYGPVLFQLRDRRERPMVLAPTHEEAVTDLFRKTAQSYRDLPQRVFQMQTKFRDEPRPRGGLIRVREFIMKDAYSFDIDEQAFQRTYAAMAEAYHNVYRRCAVPVVAVQADSGAIGGKQSEEFIFLTEIGEDNIALCDSCGYAANQERAEFSRGAASEEDALPMEDVATPGTTTIEALAEFLGVPAERTAKAAFFLVDGEPTFAVIRGDLEVNELKLLNALGADEARALTPEEVAEAGWIAGYASPVGRRRGAGRRGPQRGRMPAIWSAGRTARAITCAT